MLAVAPSKRLLAQHDFTLRQLQYAVAVSETLSFRGAAKLLHVSQPTLSTQLKELEQSLGVTLFERDRRGVMTTPQSGLLFEQMRLVLREALELSDAAARRKDPLAGPMTIGVIPTISPYLLPLVAPALHTSFPKLQLRWVEDKTESLVAGLSSGSLDAALLALEADLGPVDHSVVMVDPFVLCVPKGHRLASTAKPIRTADLAEGPLLLLEEGHCFRSQALEVCSTTRLQEHEFRATSLSTLVQMVASGTGITLLPSVAVAVEGSRADVVTRPLRDLEARRTIALAYRRRSAVGGALVTLAEVMRRAAARLGSETVSRRSKP